MAHRNLRFTVKGKEGVGFPYVFNGTRFHVDEIFSWLKNLIVSLPHLGVLSFNMAASAVEHVREPDSFSLELRCSRGSTVILPAIARLR